MISQTNQDGDTVTISDEAKMQQNGAQNSTVGNFVEGSSGSSATSEPPGAPDTSNQGE
ncbi:hypothetical protein [Paenibacillus sp. CAA11]|uniref:hypothetical protein n=1 Tax=Paenibacillus sp. CAA11 TaxID=1532905 RepID=UPI00131EE952|nr:hypothetical protein [Paenibacillus sp. CAA11]